jgi:hypothetical protein
MVYRKLVFIGLALLMALSFTVPAAAQADDTDKDGAFCDGTAAMQHPVGVRLAAQSDLTYEAVMALFCQGYGFGQIKKAVAASARTGEPVEMFLTEKTNLGGWGLVWESYGLGGPPPHAKAFKNNPGRGPKPKDGPAPDGD